MSTTNEKTPLSWGKPKIEFAKLGESPMTWQELPTPVLDSTQLTTEKGEKKEAPVEGGSNEAVRYGKNKYTFAFELRAVKGRTKPFNDNDGVVSGEYAVRLTPEDPENKGILIERCVFSMEQTYSTAEGEKWKYTADVLVPNDGTSQIKQYPKEDSTEA